MQKPNLEMDNTENNNFQADTQSNTVDDGDNTEVDIDDVARLEALLFAHGEPVELKKLASVLGLDRKYLKKAFVGLNELLSVPNRGLALLMDSPIDIAFSKDGWGSKKAQLVTKPELGRLLEDFVKDELREDLTPASLEALSIISYLGPISRSRIDYIRGVNSSFILRTLALRGLVERAPDPEQPGAFVYSPTFDLLKHLGVSSTEELPGYGKFSTMADLNSEEEDREEDNYQ